MIGHVAYLVLAHAAGATRTPENALVVLNVLPATRSPLALTAVLSRGFNEFQPRLAVKYGHALALLPHYPPHILYANLDETMMTAAKLGDLPALQPLWKLAGPDMCGQPLWVHTDKDRILDLAINAGHVHVMEWLNQVTKATDLDLGWQHVKWEKPAENGQYHMLQRGHLPALTPFIAIASTEHGDTLYISDWLVDQPDKPVAVVAIKRARNYFMILHYASVSTLDWWWTHIAQGTELPSPPLFAQIVESCCHKKDPAYLDWWWTRFLQHRTPKHTFGLPGLHAHSSGTHWDPSMANTFELAPDWHDLELPEMDSFTCCSLATETLQWWIEKCSLLGRKLVVPLRYVRNCNLKHLKCILALCDELETEASKADIETLLEKARLRSAQRPPQISWWRFTDSDMEDLKAQYEKELPQDQLKRRQKVCNNAILFNISTVQNWLHSRLELLSDLVIKPPDELTPLLFTLEFIAAIAPDFDMEELSVWPPTNQTLVQWQCARDGTTVESMLPLAPEEWDTVFYAHTNTIPEWWLQLHLAGGHPIVFMHVDASEMGINMSSSCEVYSWLQDVIARKIPILMQSEADPSVLEPFVLSTFFD
ncbi:hypothetical protein BC828DRAFT_399304 [Blastocladiella britannica]|nr:hypothetical protein BC828DRAFT_399304 [Blastocladiella britannica]